MVKHKKSIPVASSTESAESTLEHVDINNSNRHPIQESKGHEESRKQQPEHGSGGGEELDSVADELPITECDDYGTQRTHQHTLHHKQCIPHTCTDACTHTTYILSSCLINLLLHSLPLTRAPHKTKHHSLIHSLPQTAMSSKTQQLQTPYPARSDGLKTSKGEAEPLIPKI